MRIRGVTCIIEKKDYKYYCRSCKLSYNREEGIKLRDLKRKNPRHFWKLFRKQTRSGSNDITLQYFQNYFQTLASDAHIREDADVEEFLNSFSHNEENSTFQELDEPIT